MEKIRDFIKKHPINAFGIIIAAFCIFRWYSIGSFFTSMIEYIFYFFYDKAVLFLIGTAAVLLACFFANAAAFAIVKKDSPTDIIALSAIFGSWGAFMGTFFNREYKYANAVKVIFNVQAWIFVCIAVPVCIYWANFSNPFVIYRF